MHHFSPFVLTVDGQLGREAKVFMTRIADKLSSKWQNSHSKVIGWVQTQLCFAILRAMNRYI